MALLLQLSHSRSLQNYNEFDWFCPRTVFHLKKCLLRRHLKHWKQTCFHIRTKFGVSSKSGMKEFDINCGEPKILPVQAVTERHTCSFTVLLISVQPSNPSSSPCVGLELDFCYKCGGHRHSRTQLRGFPHVQRTSWRQTAHLWPYII